MEIMQRGGIGMYPFREELRQVGRRCGHIDRVLVLEAGGWAALAMGRAMLRR